MLALMFFAAVAAAPAASPLVPGGCTEPAAAHRDEAGCYLLSEFVIQGALSELYWHVVKFPDLAAASAEQLRHKWCRAVDAHGNAWLLVIADKIETFSGALAARVIGPMTVPAGGTASVRFLISNFPPGMHTRVHSHPGSEAFYIVNG